MKTIIAIIFFISSLCLSVSGQRDTVIRTIHSDTAVTLVPCTSTVITRTITDSIIRYVSVKDTAVVVPPSTYTPKGMYVSPIADWLSDPHGNLSWAKREGVNELSLYARAYLQSSTKRKQLADFIKIAKEQYGIKKVFVDYRLTSELPFWTTFVQTYPGMLDGMNTEREPYVTGDYAGFWPFLNEGSKTAKKLNLELICYMGHPSQQGWDSIVYYCDKIYLSNYIKMSVFNGSGGTWSYVKGRWGYITNSAKKLHKVANVSYIWSLENIRWGANSDFMGDAFLNNSFYGSTYDRAVKEYESNSSSEIKQYTDLNGSIIFYSKYGQLARPK